MNYSGIRSGTFTSQILSAVPFPSHIMWCTRWLSSSLGMIGISLFRYNNLVASSSSDYWMSIRLSLAVRRSFSAFEGFTLRLLTAFYSFCCWILRAFAYSSGSTPLAASRTQITVSYFVMKKYKRTYDLVFSLARSLQWSVPTSFTMTSTSSLKSRELSYRIIICSF